MARPISHHMLSFAGKALVVAVLGFIILPAFVVTVASFNDKAILSFPPQQLSLRWFYNAINYRDFRLGFQNGLIVMLATSIIALIVGSAFAYVIDRYRFRGRSMIEGLLLAPLVVPHFTVGLGMLIFAAQIGDDAHVHRRDRLPGHSGPAVCASQCLYFVAQPRSAARTRRGEPRRKAMARAFDRDAAAADAGPCQRLAVRSDPVVQRIHRRRCS